MKQKLFSMLVLLVAVATGAWADESETINTATNGKTVYTGTHFKITASFGCDNDGITLWDQSNSGTATIEALNGENITKIEMHMTYGGQVADKTTTTAGKLVATNSSTNANDISVTDINATSVTIGTSYNGFTWIGINKFVIYYGAAPASYSVTLAEGTEDSDKWVIEPKTGLKGGETVTATYKGEKKVKSVKAVKKAPAGPTAYTLAESTVGMIIGSNGKAYAADDKDNLPSGVTAEALVCYVDGNGHGLALALTDEEGTMNWSTAQTTCTAHTPAITGGTWKLASVDEWNKMISAAGSYTALRDGFSSVGGTNMKSDNYYWSSTEFNSDLARDYDFDEGEWSADSKGNVDYVRACLGF